jgi:hypothetical protein
MTGQSSSRNLNTASLARRSSFESPREEPGAESPPPPSPAPRASTTAPPGATRAGRNWGREVAALGLGFHPLGCQEGATRGERFYLPFYLISQRFCVFLDENCPLIKKAGQLILRQQGSHYLYKSLPNNKGHKVSVVGLSVYWLVRPSVLFPSFFHPSPAWARPINNSFVGSRTLPSEPKV